MLHDIFVSGLRSSKLISTLITECQEKSFYDSVERAKTLEQVLPDAEDINPSVKVHSQNRVDTNKVQNKINATVKIPKKFLKITCASVVELVIYISVMNVLPLSLNVICATALDS